MQIRSRSVLPVTTPIHTNLGLYIFGITLKLEQGYKKKSEEHMTGLPRPGLGGVKEGAACSSPSSSYSHPN